ncbi:CCA tRNA nucleotidyltransferase [Halostagnicola kamekurae]|uniref:CCA-adding enzyme n=1 Tax=Halostagnicola kamekurae TaxID=619731 RepID=A0A1I6RPB7_9EURY|nr:CCA tRNA nucleotidyltransferase [Halostagnicola kamekurae]SFS66571.1 tRNA nucleotidyltransferase (CCA-adding enzyme) [Halostagnicola kamekurae]
MTAEDEDRERDDSDSLESGSGPADPATDSSLEAVVSRVRERVIPDDAEREALSTAATTLIDRADAAATARCPDADVLQVGSTARDTWISGDRDIDIFVRFPPNLDRETLEEYGLEVGHETLPSGHEEFAEHPYVKGKFEGFDVDVVPCFRLESATDIRSAVDRTPFHTRYLNERLDDEITADVRVTKQFCKGIGVYGSDLRTRGFSGYLTELLVCEYGGFRPLLEAASDWNPPVRLDPERPDSSSVDGSDTAPVQFDDPLVVIDPTDPERNVAAVASADNVARFQHYARDVLESPRESLFEPHEPAPLDAAALRAHLANRGTTPVAVRFDAPDLVEDQLYPQLRKSLSGITSKLDARGFDVFRATTFADDSAVVFVELAVTERPALERHDGPPVHVRSHAEGFFDAYADDPDAYGPFIDGDRYVTEREREFTTATAFLESERLLEAGLGAHVETALEDGYDVLVGDDVTELLGEFDRELARYYDPRP